MQRAPRSSAHYTPISGDKVQLAAAYPGRPRNVVGLAATHQQVSGKASLCLARRGSTPASLATSGCAPGHRQSCKCPDAKVEMHNADSCAAPASLSVEGTDSMSLAASASEKVDGCESYEVCDAAILRGVISCAQPCCYSHPPRSLHSLGNRQQLTKRGPRCRRLWTGMCLPKLRSDILGLSKLQNQ